MTTHIWDTRPKSPIDHLRLTHSSLRSDFGYNTCALYTEWEAAGRKPFCVYTPYLLHLHALPLVFVWARCSAAEHLSGVRLPQPSSVVPDMSPSDEAIRTLARYHKRTGRLPPRDARGHRTRYSDSSVYDEVCLTCGATDARSPNDRLSARCPQVVPDMVADAICQGRYEHWL